MPSHLDNPYAAPADLGPESRAPLPGPQRQARRSTRLAAALVDTLLIVVVFVVGVLLNGFIAALAVKTGIKAPDTSAQATASSPFDASKLLTVFFVFLPALLFYGYQSALIARHGQTLAKRWFRIRIVRCSGEPAGFVRGVLVRSWLMALVEMIPIFGSVLAVFDALMIFGSESRCIHDALADTMVIEEGL